MKFAPYLPDPGEEYHDNIGDAAEALRARLDPTSRKMLTHLLTLISYERGRAGETIRCLTRDIDAMHSPCGIVMPTGAVWWDGKQLHYQARQ